MKMVVVGPGAMGCLFGGLLAEAGHDVWLLDCVPENAEKIKSRGLRVEGLDGQERHVPFEQITVDPGQIGTADLVMFFVKAFDTPAAASHAEGLVAEHTTLLTLQNGLGNIEALCSLFPREQVIAGTTAYGATLLGSGHVRHAGIGDTVIGAVNKKAAALTAAVREVLEKAGIAVKTADDINAVIWGKLLVNVGINPLTAIMKIRNGEILDHPELVEVMKQAVGEAASVAASLGITIPYPEPITKVLEVCRATAGNRSSMLQDIEAGKKTEIGHINGAVVEHGRSQKVPTPVNSLLANLVLAIEQQGTGSREAT